MAKAKKEDVVIKITPGGIDGVIMTPAGPPPCKPDNLPNTTDDEVVSWIFEIVECGKAKGFEYGYTAVQYFARRFWNVHETRYKEVCLLIKEIMNPSTDVV